MKCKKCGEKINENAKYCENCGEKANKNSEEIIIEAEKVNTQEENIETKIEKQNTTEINLTPVTEDTEKEETKTELIENKKENVKQAEIVREEKTGLSVASLILGIIAVLCLFEHGILNFICAILAIIFGAIGRKKGAKGIGTTGMVLGIISLAIFVLIISFILFFASMFLVGLAAS